MLLAGCLGRWLTCLLYPELTVTSWWRTPWHNAEVGGAWNSLHQLGLAVDVTPVNQTTADKLKHIWPWVYVEGDHVHAGFSWYHEDGVVVQ